MADVSDPTTQLRSNAGILVQDGALTDATEKKIYTTPVGSFIEAFVWVVNKSPSNNTTIRLYALADGGTRQDTNAIAWDIHIPKVGLMIGPIFLDEGDELYARADNGLTGITGAVITVMGRESNLA